MPSAGCGLDLVHGLSSLSSVRPWQEIAARTRLVRPITLLIVGNQVGRKRPKEEMVTGTSRATFVRLSGFVAADVLCLAVQVLSENKLP